MNIKFGGHYFINCPTCGETIEYNERCKCGYSTFDEHINMMKKQIEKMERENNLAFNEEYY